MIWPQFACGVCFTTVSDRICCRCCIMWTLSGRLTAGLYTAQAPILWGVGPLGNCLLHLAWPHYILVKLEAPWCPLDR